MQRKDVVCNMIINLQRTPSGKYIMRMDASLYKKSNCHRYIWFRLIRGLVEGEGQKDFKIEYGTAFHKGLALWYSGKPLEQCLDAAFNHYNQDDIFKPDSDYRNTAHLILCFRQYADYYKKEGETLTPLYRNGNPVLEISFAYPYYSTPLVDVVMCGTIDFRGVFGGSIPVIVDHKTTGSYYPETFLDSYCISPQLMMYKMIWELLFPAEDVQCMVNGIFLRKSNKNEFRRSLPIEFSPYTMERFKDGLYHTVQHIVEGFQRYLATRIQGRSGQNIVEDFFIPNYTECDGKFGMCEFLPLCLAGGNTSDEDGIAETHYQQRVYDPSEWQK